MPQNYEILGQAAPVAATDTTLYTVPVSTQVVVSKLMIVNRDAIATTARAWVRKNGEATADKQIVVPDVVVAGNNGFPTLEGVTLSAGDILMVKAGSSFLSFNLFGLRITP